MHISTESGFMLSDDVLLKHLTPGLLLHVFLQDDSHSRPQVDVDRVETPQCETVAGESPFKFSFKGKIYRNCWLLFIIVSFKGAISHWFPTHCPVTRDLSGRNKSVVGM